MASEKSKLNQRTHVTRPDIRSFKTGTTLFEEGSFGKDIFVIKEGKVGIYKNSENGEVELTELGPGDIVGEMSLLDNLPRSATVRAKENTKAQVVTQAAFSQTLQKTPVWLSSIIKILVSRLRDANKRVNQSALSDPLLAVVRYILLLYEPYQYEFQGDNALSYSLVCNEIQSVCKIPRSRVTSLLSKCEKARIIEISQDTDFNKHLCIKDIEVLSIFVRFRTLRQKNENFTEMKLSQKTMDTLQNIAYVAQKSGTQSPEGILLHKSKLLDDLSGADTSALQKDLLELRKKGIIDLCADGNDETIVFRRETLNRVKKIRYWTPRFEEMEEV